MVEIFITFIAGIVSFISPCVLPLVPAYIGYMGGRVTNTVSAQVSTSGGGTATAARPASARFNTVMHGVAFVAGFTFIFVMLGVLGTALITLGGTNTITDIIGRLGGVMIIFFGLHFMGVMPSLFSRLKGKRDETSRGMYLLMSIGLAISGIALLTWGFTGTLTPWAPAEFREPETWTITSAIITSLALVAGMFAGGAFTDPTSFWRKSINTIERGLYADTRREMTAKGDDGYAGSAIMGVVFAAGWTPCIGPTLGAAMTLAASTGADATRGGILLAAYSMGLGIPFLLTALMLDSAQGFLRKLQRHMRAIELVSGAFLVAVGFIIASGQLQTWSQQLSGEFADFSYQVEECVVGFVEGNIAFGSVGACINGEEVVVEDGETTTPVENSASEPTSNTVREDVPVGLRVGNIAPDFQATDLNGNTVNLSDYRGQVVLLNFWYTTCPPCRIEMPDLEAAYQEYNDQGFVVLAVNREESPETIQPFVDELDLSFPVLLDQEGVIQDDFNVTGYPTTYVIDENGVITRWNPGFLVEEQIQQFIEDAF